MWRSRGEHMLRLEDNRILRLVRRVVPLTSEYRGQSFLVRDAGRWLATPLFAVLVVVETTDIMFAIDSIPAVFAVTDDAFIVFSSNAFALLGLRSLYFLLAGMIGRFVYLKAGLSALLVFAGVKILLSGVWEMPIWLSLTTIAAILGVAVAASLITDRRGGDRSREGSGPGDQAAGAATRDAAAGAA
jgi:tellurite resistance protein TerC